MAVDLTDPKDSFWIEVAGARFKCLHWRWEEYQGLRRRYFPRGKKGMSRRQIFDLENLMYLDLLDRVILDWEGVGINGRPVECTRGNKNLLPEIAKNRVLILTKLSSEVEVHQEAVSPACQVVVEESSAGELPDWAQTEDMGNA